MAEHGNLVEKEFWEQDYYASVELPARPRLDFAPDRCLVAGLKQFAPVGAGQTVLEVGCAPGRWLLWYAEEFRARTTGIEYTDRGVELTRRNFEAAGVDGAVAAGDFFDAGVVAGKFDLVLSLGFIEHFDDLSRAFNRHVEFMADGGRLAIGVPNFRGLIGLLQRWGDPELLAKHNRDAMKPRVYERLASAAGLRVEHVAYLNPLDPNAIIAKRHGPGIVTVPMGVLRRPWMDNLNQRSISSYLLVTFRRR
jgi:SAM-dependent methyltransferase